ncbi:MAG: hypothetical protein ABIJ97_05725 [Bacteroidota bacterium]
MKKIDKLLIIAAILCMTFSSAHAYKNVTEKSSGSTKGISEGCVQGSSSIFLDLNNVRSLIHTGGDMWWDLQGEASYEVPKGSGKMSLFAGGIWIGGVDLNGQLRSCAVRYRSAGVDYWPGPLVTSGANQGGVTSDVCDFFDRHFAITRVEVEKFRTWFRAKEDGETDILESEDFLGYAPPKIFEEWPAHGDLLAGAGYDHYLAPFYDYNGDEEYDPNDGDYPFYDLDGELPCGTTRELRKPRLYGDQTLWWVYNDRGNVHMESNGTAIGMEIRAQAFCFATSDELNDMTFANYALINRSSYTLTETYFGVWTDADLGFCWDDYVGCDVNRGLGYLYNGKEEDGTGSGITYGAQPPAIGVDFFEGPYQDADGIDNMSNWVPGTSPKTLDCARTNIAEGSINGLNFEDGIVDNERWGMRRFIFFNNNSSSYGDPNIDVEYYHYLKGKWRDGSDMTFGGSGYSGSVPTDFMFPGKPTSDICGWGTDGNPMGDWSEESAGTTPFDRRFVHSAGPFTLEPGATNDITTGMVWARASGGGPWESVKEVQRADDKAQKLFENCFQVVDGPDAPELDIIELDRKLIFQIYNKKGSNNFKYIPEDYYEKDPFIVCPVDNPTCDIYFHFEGYQVFQLKDKDASVADISNIEKAKLVFQCDKENYDESGSAIGKLINYEYRADVGAIVPTVKVDGKNEGIEHTFVITEDLFATGDKKIVNHKKYYYIAVAYGYNNYKQYIQTDANSLDGQKEPYKAGRKAFSGSIKSYMGIPHIPSPANQGTILNSTYGDTPEIVLLEGKGNGDRDVNLNQETIDRIMAGDPWKVDSIGYEKGYGPINVKVVDPLNVKEKAFYLGFDSILVTSTRKSKILRAKWYLYDAEDRNTLYSVTMADSSALGDTVAKFEDYSDYPPFIVGVWKRDAEGNIIIPLALVDSFVYPPSTIFSDAWVSEFTGKRKTNINEQLITDYGISISIGQVDFPLDETDVNTHVNNGYLDATIDFTDVSKTWLYFIPDQDGCDVFDWIKSGKLEEQGCAACNDYTKPVNDSKEDYENILFRTWAPYMLANKDYFREPAKDDATNEVVSICTRKYGLAYYYGHTQIDERVFQIQSVDLVITSDQSKWTRSPVIEMCEYDTTGGFHANGLSEGNTLKFSLRNHLSVGKDGNPDGELDSDTVPRKGMGWFPGYAINVETGERLNIMFGEDSKFPQDNGRDLIWNPSSRWTTDLFISGAYGDVAAGDVVWGGKHVIYIMGHSDLASTDKYYQPSYDEGETIYKNLKQASATNAQDNFRRYVFSNAMWVGTPILNPEYNLLETDVKIRLRVANPYQVGKFDFAKSNPRNYNNPLFYFDLTDLAPTTDDLQTAKDALDLIRAVPNPYKGYSEYELSTLDRVVKFTNLPQTCTISIYSVGGTLIRRYEKDNTLSYVDWDLKNSFGIDIASGVYIIYVNAPGIGEKVIKWFGSLRPIDLSTF